LGRYIVNNFDYNVLSQVQYQKMQSDAADNPADFWGKIAKNIDWHIPFHEICNTAFDKDNFKIEWFKDGRLNASYNAVDRHAAKTPHKTALIWESDCGTITKHYTFAELKTEIEYFAAALRHISVGDGDCVIIYMPMIPEAIFAMLACSRIGAVHCVVFGGFSANALAERMIASKAQFVITADEGLRGGKVIPLKHNVNEALQNHKTNIRRCLVVQRTQNPNINYDADRDVIYDTLKPNLNFADGGYKIVPSEHPLFILYTSGSTGKPKGLLHTTGGYCVYTAFTHALSFNNKPNDVFFCTADIGWITGHSYMVYGALLNGTTSLIFEGTPTYPDAGRLWSICDKHKVTTLYTAPTALRTLMGQGDAFIEPYDLSSLRVLGTVGEPINPQVYEWYKQKIGKNRCPIVDTWWQTETGGHIIASPAFLSTADAGVAGKAYPAIKIAILDDEGQAITQPNQQGSLVIENSWPGQARTIYGDHSRFFKTYFSKFKGYYLTGDGAYYTDNHDIQITGRIDDVLNISGHRMGTAELESALVAHDCVAEAAIVGIDHAIKGQAIYAYVTLMQGVEESEEMIKTLKQTVRQKIGAIATPDIIHITSDMPKTRSGKIMRRILRKIANQQFNDFGDLSTLANPDIIQSLVAGAKKKN
jgi:acetyl-CoA synthetase